MSRPLRRSLLRALLVASSTALALWLLRRWGVAGPVMFGLVAAAGLIAWMFPRLGVRLLDEAILFARSRFWAAQSGRFHSFAGVALHVVDDGRQIWIGGDGLQRVLGRSDADDVLAARHAGNWRHDADGALLLRVEAVIHHLATMPDRNDPRVQRLRRYLERDVVYPAQQRRERRREV